MVTAVSVVTMKRPVSKVTAAWIALIFWAAHTRCGDVAEDHRYKAGKEKYEMLRKESSMPKYSECWTSALSGLQAGCKRLSDDTQHRLALKFTNCFLKKTGREVYECGPTDAIDICTRDMKTEAYNSYTEFFTHTQNICYFLQAQAWQEETESTIEHLSDNSAKVAKQIEDSSQLQSEVIQKQNESIRNQQLLIKRGTELKQTLEESTLDVHHMVQEFKDSTTEQRVLIFEVFERLNSLQAVVMGEFTGFYSLIFYAVSILVCYLLTSTPRTSSARFWLFVIMTANIIVERLLVTIGTERYEDPATGAVMDENTLVYRRLWWCRKVFSSLAILKWIHCAYTYQDYNKINNDLLVEIKKQNSELKHLLQGDPMPPTEDSVLNQGFSDMSDSFISTDMTDVPDHCMKRDKDSSTTGYESDTDTDTVSSNSFNSMLTDRTFTATDHMADISESDAESFCTGSSRSSLQDELRDIRDATPLRDLSMMSDVNYSIVSPSTGARRGRPKGSKNKPVTPAPVQTDKSCRYNLRSQRGTTKTVPNPLVQSESAEDFGNMVRHLAKVAQRNRVKAQVTIERGQGHAGHDKLNFFSSDDD